MASPIKLLIQRKTKVPTNPGATRHDFRSDWKKVGMVEYQVSESMFSEIGGGPIATDAQFAKWIKDCYGPGIYMVTAWKKGYKGLWVFIKLQCMEETFVRLKRNPTSEELEVKDLKGDLNVLQNQFGSSSGEEREILRDEIDFKKEEIAVTGEDISDKNRRYGPAGWLKSLQPVYSIHDYEDYGLQVQEEEKIRGAW